MAAAGGGVRGAELLARARAALTEALGGGSTPKPDAPEPEAAWLGQPGACFVTLEVGGELRGCIGTIEPYRPLGEDVHANTLAAAFRDPRFPSLESSELPRVRISVALLSELEPLSFADEDDLARQLEPGVDGLVLEHESHRGTFLPAVWRHYPEPGQFLRQLKRKAGLEPGFWAPGVQVSRYTVESWSETAA